MDKQELKDKATPASYPAKGNEAAAEKAPEVLDTVYEPVEVELTQAELADVGKQLAAKVSELTSHAAKKKEVMADLKSREASIQASIERLHTQLINGTRAVEVEVDLVADFSRNVVHYVRRDNSKVLRERPLEPEERQQMLGLEDDEKDGQDEAEGAEE